MKKVFGKKGNPPNPGQDEGSPRQGIAHIPATVLTVEYVDDSEGMDSALRAVNDHVRKLEQQVGAIEESQTRMVVAINQQAKDIVKAIESIGRRIDRLYTRISELLAGAEGEVATMLEDVEAPATAREAAAGAVGGGLPADVADDPDHQNAWRIARVLAADLEAYHEEAVKEGVIYGTFYRVLKEPIEKARSTYEQRVSKEIAENYDYFSKALDELIARKSMELKEGGRV
jgi:cell division protein ZapA (FtsZ GTPase activity inhibitor)